VILLGPQRLRQDHPAVLPGRHTAPEVGGQSNSMTSRSQRSTAASWGNFRRDKVGIIFQAFNLVPSLTALENVMVPLRAAGVSRSSARQRAEELLTRVNLADR